MRVPFKSVLFASSLLVFFGCNKKSSSDAAPPPPEAAAEETGGEGGGSDPANDQANNEGGNEGSGDQANNNSQTASSGAEGNSPSRKYSKEKFQGSRDEAVKIAGGLALAANFDLINANAAKLSLALNATDYDRMETFSYTFDPSLSLVKDVRANLCVLNKLDYKSLPETEQVVSTAISSCLPKAKKGEANKGGQGGGDTGGSSGGSGGESGSDSSKKDDNKKAQVTFVSYLNVDEQLVVEFNYSENSEFFGEIFKKVTFVISEGVSEANPFGSFLVNVEGRMGSKDGSPQYKSEMAIGRELAPEAAPGEVGLSLAENPKTTVRFIEQNQMGSYKRMSGEILLGNTPETQGQVVGGTYIADIQGFDESGEPGGQYKVAFNGDLLKREKTIEDISKIFGADFGGTINQEPVLKCYKPKEFKSTVFSYRSFNEDGSALDAGAQGFEFALGKEADSTRGFADYYGVHVWSNDGMPVDLADGTKAWIVDWENFDMQTGQPSFGEELTIYSKPGKITSYASQAVDMAKLDGKNLDWIWATDENGEGKSYRIVWDDANKKFMRTAFWEEPESTGDPMSPMGQGKWQAIDPPTEHTVDGQIWTWNEAVGGEMIISPDNSTSPPTYSAITKSMEELKQSPSSLTLYCLSNCPKPGGILISDLEALNDPSNTDDYDTKQAKIYLPEVTDINQPHIYVLDDFTLSKDGEEVTLTGTASANSFGGSQVWVEKLMTEAVFTAAKTKASEFLSEGMELSAWEVNQAAETYYSYTMGTDAWSKTIVLKKADGSNVEFSGPSRFSYELTEADIRDASYQDKVGEFYNIEMHGGWLNIPWEADGYETDPFSGQQWERWAPAFALKDGTVLTDNDGKKFKLKADFVEKRMVEADLAACDILAFNTELKLPEEKKLLSENGFVEDPFGDFAEGDPAFEEGEFKEGEMDPNMDPAMMDGTGGEYMDPGMDPMMDGTGDEYMDPGMDPGYDPGMDDGGALPPPP